MINNFILNIQKFWFTPVPPQRLALLRIATGSFALWYLLSRFEMLQKIVSSNLSNFQPIGILKWMDAPIEPEVFYLISLALIGLNLAYILGWKFKYTGPIFAIALLFFLTYRNSWSMIYHNRNTLMIHVLIIGWVASADALSIDAWRNKIKNGLQPSREHWRYGWPIRLICTATLATYLLAGVAKLANELAIQWASGSAMRSQIAVDAIRKEILGSDAPILFEWIYPYTWLFLVMGLMTLILEVGAPLFIYRKRLAMVWAIFTWLMHWGIFLLMGIRFRYQMTGIIFLSFFEIEKLWFSGVPSQKESNRNQENTISEIPPVILFDGVCNLCNDSVRFLIEHDKEKVFQFTSLQSDVGQELLHPYNEANTLSSIVLIEEGMAYFQSEAILRITRRLPRHWSWLYAFIIIPRVFRDAVYRFVSRNRYKWFGKRESCVILDSNSSQFLD